MAPNTRRRQQRITFTPLPASSSQAEGYNKQIQDRAAAVGYGDSSRTSKRRKLQPTAIEDKDDAPTQETSTNNMLPTPAEDPQANEDEPVRSSQRSSKRRAKQKRLDFGPSSSNAVNLDPPVGQTMFKQQRGQKRAAESSGDDSDDLPSPGKFAKGAKKGNKKRKSGFMSSGGSKDARSSQPVKEPTPQEESDEDDIVVPSARKARQPQQSVIEDEDSDDDMPTTLGTQKRRRKERQSSFISSSPPAAIDGSEDELQIIDDPRSKKAANAADSDDSEDEDLPAVTPRKRLLKRRGKLSQEEQADLDEDLQFLGPSSDGEEPGRAPRSSQSIKKNARQQALERLKQVRSSQRTLADIQEDDQDEAHFSSDQRERDEMYDNSEDSPEPGPTSSRAMFDADEDDEDFIEEGDDDVLGVPDGIPLQFTRYGSMKPKELWKFAIEWMVQKKINPAFAMDDEIYELTFKKLDDEVTGLSDSKFQSSAWKTDFATALRARPDIQENPTDIELDKCDACNRSRHPVKYRVQFLGNPYHRSTLEEVGKDDDDDDDEDEDSSDSDKQQNDDQPSYDAQGRKIAPANTIWYVGKFCMANARTAHALQHWRYHLYQWVVIWIDGHDDYTSAKALKKRDKMSTKKRRKYANKIVDRMVDEGVVKQLWKEFRGTIDDAANSKQGRFEVNSP